LYNKKEAIKKRKEQKLFFFLCAWRDKSLRSLST